MTKNHFLEYYFVLNLLTMLRKFLAFTILFLLMFKLASASISVICSKINICFEQIDVEEEDENKSEKEGIDPKEEFEQDKEINACFELHFSEVLISILDTLQLFHLSDCFSETETPPPNFIA